MNSIACVVNSVINFLATVLMFPLFGIKFLINRRERLLAMVEDFIKFFAETITPILLLAIIANNMAETEINQEIQKELYK